MRCPRCGTEFTVPDMQFPDGSSKPAVVGACPRCDVGRPLGIYGTQEQFNALRQEGMSREERYYADLLFDAFKVKPRMEDDEMYNAALREVMERVYKAEIPPELFELFHTDSTVAAALTYYIQEDVPLNVALISLVRALAAEKKTLLEQMHHLLANSTRIKYPFPS